MVNFQQTRRIVVAGMGKAADKYSDPTCPCYCCKMLQLFLKCSIYLERNPIKMQSKCKKLRHLHSIPSEPE